MVNQLVAELNTNTLESFTLAKSCSCSEVSQKYDEVPDICTTLHDFLVSKMDSRCHNGHFISLEATTQISTSFIAWLPHGWKEPLVSSELLTVEA